jgi:hypothetical protein
MESHWHSSDLRFINNDSNDENGNSDKQLQNECQRILNILIKVSEHTGIWSSCSSDFSTRLLLSTEKCAKVWNTDKNETMMIVRNDFIKFVGPVRLDRLVNYSASALDKHIAQSGLNRYNKEITNAAVSLLSPPYKLRYYATLPLRIITKD